MEWNVNNEPSHKLEDIVIHEEFLVLPLTIGNTTKWLVRVRYKAKCCGVYREGSSPKIRYRWNPIEWIDL